MHGENNADVPDKYIASKCIIVGVTYVSIQMKNYINILHLDVLIDNSLHTTVHSNCKVRNLLCVSGSTVQHSSVKTNKPRGQ